MITTAYRNALIADAALTWMDSFVVATTSAVAAAAVFSAGYLVKSALGINLMPGPSPFHDLLFWILT